MRTSLAVLSLCLLPALAGCAHSGSIEPIVQESTGIQGSVRGGLQPIIGAHVYLMAANTAGYGQPSLSLLRPGSLTAVDSIGEYVTTDKQGNFGIPASFTCTSTNQVYVYVRGGDAGAGDNPAIALLAAIGGCPVYDPRFGFSVAVNEVTTVATAYAIAGFATDATHVASASSALARTGIDNAFANYNNLVSSSATALAQTPGGNGAVPQRLINTLADILAACVQSSGPASTGCSAFFQNTTYGGSTPTDTASAALNLVHNPGQNVAALFKLAAATPPFQPTLTAQPNDFTLGINFGGGGIDAPYAVAIDALGDAWFANLGNSTVSKLSSLGVPYSPAAGYSNGSPFGPVGIAIDLSGDAWIVDAFTNSLTKYSSSGALLSPIGGYVGGGLAAPQAIASDALGNTWVANYASSVSEFTNIGTSVSPSNGFGGGGVSGPVSIAIDSSGAVWVSNTRGAPHSVTKFTSSGSADSPASGYIGGGLNNPFSIAIDNDGSAWVANYSGNSVTKLSNAGAAVSPSNGFTGGGLSHPFSIAVDGGGNVWVANDGAFSVSEIANGGAPLSPATGYTGGTLKGPQAIALDGSGDVWIANSSDVTVTELIGAAVPVVTPIAAGIKTNALGARP